MQVEILLLKEAAPLVSLLPKSLPLMVVNRAAEAAKVDLLRAKAKAAVKAAHPVLIKVAQLVAANKVELKVVANRAAEAAKVEPPAAHLAQTNITKGNL